MKPIHVICAVIGGAIAGATVGLLLAPEKGTDTRKNILKLHAGRRCRILHILVEMKYLQKPIDCINFILRLNQFIFQPIGNQFPDQYIYINHSHFLRFIDNH